MKRRIDTSYTLIRGSWGHLNYFKPKRRYLVLAVSGAYNQDVWGAYGCNFSWRFQWHHRQPCPTLTAAGITNGFPFNFLLSLAALHLHGVLVLVTTNKFIAGVVATGDNCSPLLLSRVINCSLVLLTLVRKLSTVSTTQAVTENPWQGLIVGVVDTGEQLIASVFDTGEKHSFSKYLWEKFEMAPMEYLGGPGETDSWKNLKSKISCQAPFIETHCFPKCQNMGSLKILFKRNLKKICFRLRTICQPSLTAQDEMLRYRTANYREKTALFR